MLDSKTSWPSISSSLTALNIISVIDDEYDVYLKGEDIRNSSTIQELFEKVVEKVG